MRQLRFVVLGIALLASPIAAQEIAMARTGFVQTRSTPRAPGTFGMQAEGDTTIGQMVATGVVAAVVGIVGGAYVGYQMAECVSDEWFCGFAEGAAGALVGSTLMIPAGIHLVSSHSPFLAKLGTSVIVMGTAAALGLMTNGIAFILMPPAQIIATTRVEELAARRKGASWAQP
jgi:hypothetical protein